MSIQTILPLPTLSKTLEEVRAELFAEVEAKQDEYADKGWLPARLNLNKGVVRGILEMQAFQTYQLLQILQATLEQAVPLHASGDWLDVHCNQLGLTRKPATKATGLVKFRRAEGESLERNIPIPAGRIVRTLPDGNGEVYRYVTTVDAVLPGGEVEAGVPVESEDYGAAANAGPGQICELVTPVSGIGGVDNSADWLTSEAANRESDVELRRRYVLAWSAQAGITAAAYKSAALSVTGVTEAAIADQHPRGEGTIDIIIKGSAGIPTQGLLDRVTEAIDAVIAINHDFLVLPPEPVPLDVDFTLELLSGDETALKQAATNFIQDYFSGNNPAVQGIGIGEDVICDRLAAPIINLPGVKRIIRQSPGADITVPHNGLATLHSLSVSAQWTKEA